jgi:hypothetical protein
MAKGKGGRKVGRLLIIGGVAAVGYYGYTRGWFKPVQDWINSLTGKTPTTDPKDTTPTPTPNPNPVDPDGGGGPIDLSGLWDFLGGLWTDLGLDDALNKLLHPEKQPADPSKIAEIASQVAGALTVPTAAAAGASGAAATAAATASQTAPTIAGASPAAVSLFDPNIARFVAAGPAVWLQGAAEAFVPLYIGMSPAVAAGVHSANVKITKVLTDAGLYKETGLGIETYKLTVPGSNTKNVIVSHASGKVYDAQGNVLDISAAEVKKTGTKVGTTKVVPASGGQWDGKMWKG